MFTMKVQNKDQKLRIASYNIRKARGLDGRRAPYRIIDILNDMNADIVTLQEADRRLGHRPAAVTRAAILDQTDFVPAPLATNDVSLGWHGNAVLVKRGIGVTATQRITLPGAEPRGAVAVTLQDGLTIVGVHLGLLRTSRRKQLQKLMDAFAEPRQTVIIGDMNEWSHRCGFEPIADTYTLYNPGRSFHAARPVAALDRFAISGDLALYDAGVVQTPLTKRASDHLPIWADIHRQPLKVETPA